MAGHGMEAEILRPSQNLSTWGFKKNPQIDFLKPVYEIEDIQSLFQISTGTWDLRIVCPTLSKLDLCS